VLLPAWDEAFAIVSHFSENDPPYRMAINNEAIRQSVGPRI
jgi:hypothetical protein